MKTFYSCGCLLFNSTLAIQSFTIMPRKDNSREHTTALVMKCSVLKSTLSLARKCGFDIRHPQPHCTFVNTSPTPAHTNLLFNKHIFYTKVHTAVIFILLAKQYIHGVRPLFPSRNPTEQWKFLGVYGNVTTESFLTLSLAKWRVYSTYSFGLL